MVKDAPSLHAWPPLFGDVVVDFAPRARQNPSPGHTFLMTVVATVLALSLAIGFLAGGSLRPFERLRIHWWGAALIGLALQASVTWDARSRSFEVAALIGSYALLLAFVGVNRRVPGAALMFAGLFMNLAVIAPNAGMPVDPGALRAIGGVGVSVSDGKHLLATSDTVLPELGDTIPLPTPFRDVLSPGDAILYAGLAWCVVMVMRGRFRENVRAPARWIQGYRGKHEPIRPHPSRSVTRPWAAAGGPWGSGP